MKKYLFILFLAAFITPLNAKHIVGGEMTYTITRQQNNINTYHFQMKIYRDVFTNGGALMDAVARIYIYKQTAHVMTFGVPFDTIVQLKLPEIRWLSIPSNIGVEVGTYQWTTDLPVSTDAYIVNYQRCCRNETIQNIVNPADIGATYSVEITPNAQRFSNNSPVFGNYPPILICAQEPINVLQNAIDIDGDRLVYRLCAALEGSRKLPNPTDNLPPPFVSVSYRSPTYSATQPMTGVPPLSIDSLTGRLIGKPDMIGQFIVTVCVEEYRNNVLMGKVYRDFQFNVVPCQGLPNGGLAAPILINPQNNAALPTYNNLNLTWTDVQNATAYLFEISQLTDFSDAFQFETTTPDILLTNTRVLGFLKPNQRYYWRAKAFRAGEISSNYSTTFSFTTGILNKSAELTELNDFSIQPNPLSNSTYLSLKITADKAFNSVISLTNSAGQILLNEKYHFETGINECSIFIGQLPNGFYTVGMATDKGVLRKKLIILN